METILPQNSKLNPQCLVCGSKNTKLIFKNMSGFESGTYYDIFKCESCKSHFIDENKIDYSIYDKIYEHTDKTITYKRYQKYFNEIKNVNNKLQYLCDQEEIPLVIKFYLNTIKKQKDKISILEIGCGLGYTTYALNKEGYNCCGLDISKNSIKKAKEKFGDYYIVGDANKLGSNDEHKGKYDVVFAQEVIEHISNISGFIDNIIKFLKPGGALILTTPNKDYMPNKCIWFSEKPPVHTCLIGSYFFKKYAVKNSLRLSIFNYNTQIKNRNRLGDLFLSHKWMRLNNNDYLLKEGIVFNKLAEEYNCKENKIKNKIYIYLNNKFFCCLSYYLLKIIFFWLPSPTLGIIMEKNK